MEPEWTKTIPNQTVCNFFYFFFVLYAVITILAFFGLISLFFMNLPKQFLIPSVMQLVLSGVIAAASALFHYLVCSRALLSGGKA